ncbi:hypothetical protein, partial [Amycolatopsis azurea]
MTDTRDLPAWLSQANDAFNDSLGRELDLDKTLEQVKSRARIREVVPASRPISVPHASDEPVAAAV